MREQQNMLNLPLGPKCLSSILAPASSNFLTSLVDSFPLSPKQAACIISKKVYIHNSVPDKKNLLKFWPQAKIWLNYAKKWPMQNIFSVMQKLQQYKHLEILRQVKNSLHQNYGFMVLPGKALWSRIRNFCPFQNISFLAWENLKNVYKLYNCQ